jgi:hypothetical protein
MQEEQAKDFQADAALEGLDEELSVDELAGVAGGSIGSPVASDGRADRDARRAQQQRYDRYR